MSLHKCLGSYARASQPKGLGFRAFHVQSLHKDLGFKGFMCASISVHKVLGFRVLFTFFCMCEGFGFC